MRCKGAARPSCPGRVLVVVHRVIHAVVIASLVAGLGVVVPRPAAATHGAEHERLDQQLGTCNFQHREKQDDITTVPEALGNGSNDFVSAGHGCVVAQDVFQIEVLMPDDVSTMTSVDVVEVRVAFDYVVGAAAIIGGTCSEAFGLNTQAWLRELNAGGTPLDSHAIGIASPQNHCSTGSVDTTVVFTDPGTHYVGLDLNNNFSVSNLMLWVSDPGGSVTPPDCEDDPDAFCEEPPVFDGETCDEPADWTDVAGVVALVACQIVATIGMVFDVLAYIAGFLAWAVGAVLAAIGGIVSGILDGLLGLLGDIFGGIGGLLGSLLQALFVPGEGLGEAWDDLMDLLNTKAPIGWMLQVITFLTDNLTAANLSGPALTTFGFSILGAAVSFETAGVVGALDDYRGVLAALIYLACAWVIFHRIGGTLRGNEA